jgi:hypothetical protein
MLRTKAPFTLAIPCRCLLIPALVTLLVVLRALTACPVCVCLHVSTMSLNIYEFATSFHSVVRCASWLLRLPCLLERLVWLHTCACSWLLCGMRQPGNWPRSWPALKGEKRVTWKVRV